MDTVLIAGSQDWTVATLAVAIAMIAPATLAVTMVVLATVEMKVVLTTVETMAGLAAVVVMVVLAIVEKMADLATAVVVIDLVDIALIADSQYWAVATILAIVVVDLVETVTSNKLLFLTNIISKIDDRYYIVVSDEKKMQKKPEYG